MDFWRPESTFWDRFDAFVDALHLRGIALAGCALMLGLTLAFGNYEHAAEVLLLAVAGWSLTREGSEL